MYISPIGFSYFPKSQAGQGGRRRGGDEGSIGGGGGGARGGGPLRDPRTAVGGGGEDGAVLFRRAEGLPIQGMEDEAGRDRKPGGPRRRVPLPADPEIVRRRQGPDFQEKLRRRM